MTARPERRSKYLLKQPVLVICIQEHHLHSVSALKVAGPAPQGPVYAGPSSRPSFAGEAEQYLRWVWH